MTDAPTQPSPELRRLSYEQRMWRWRILISTYFAYAGFYLCRKVYGICKTTLCDDFGWDLQKVAHVWTVFLTAYMIGQFVNSFIGRKWGPRVLLLGGLGLSIIFNVIFGFANSYWTFLVFMFFNGLVQAAGWPGSVGAVSEWLRPKERGTIMGFWSTNYLVGNIAVKYVGGALLGGFVLYLNTPWGKIFNLPIEGSWRHAFFGCTFLAFGVWWIIYFWQRTKPEDVGLEPLVTKGDIDKRTVHASTEQHITFREYSQLLLSPVVLLMGLSYFCIKFLRYALDSWLPTFLNLQGLPVDKAAYYSSVFDYAGLAGAILAGIALDRVFRGRWDVLCFVMGLGTVVGYFFVVRYGANPYALAFSFGLVGFMIYGPDTLLAGAASVQVAGARNGVAVAGIVDGIGSIGPVIQEEVIGWIMKGKDSQAAIRNANLLTLSMSVAFVVLIAVVIWRVHVAHRLSPVPVEGSTA